MNGGMTNKLEDRFQSQMGPFQPLSFAISAASFSSLPLVGLFCLQLLPPTTRPLVVASAPSELPPLL